MIFKFRMVYGHDPSRWLLGLHYKRIFKKGNMIMDCKSIN
jgi:hypothetical protein